MQQRGDDNLNKVGYLLLFRITVSKGQPFTWQNSNKLMCNNNTAQLKICGQSYRTVQHRADQQSSCFTNVAPEMTQHAITFKPNLYVISGYNQLQENCCNLVPQKMAGKNDKNNRIH